MIDNVILLITGTLHQRAISELVPKCHPLGSFEQMEAVNIAQTPAELYNAILVDTPLGNCPLTLNIQTLKPLFHYWFQTDSTSHCRRPLGLAFVASPLQQVWGGILVVSIELCKPPLLSAQSQRAGFSCISQVASLGHWFCGYSKYELPLHYVPMSQMTYYQIQSFHI